MITPSKEIVAKWLELLNLHTWATIIKTSGMGRHTIERALAGHEISMKSYNKLNNCFIRLEETRKQTEDKLCSL
jgi:hypothetical protein